MTEVTPTPEANDVANNKVFAILAYFGILFLVPLLAAKDSPFARFHANQGLNLFLLTIALYIVFYILLIISYRLALIINLVYLVIAVLAILGIINAAKGEMKELPLIGKFRFIK
ncbi:MAG: DUF4870 domain-containing protein [Dysgonamonadaceae bacterium]|jgi:uncharacterized membrane protein|nr:DUF4870 domain-containing protein [Dysgonamonadaceae bacterium]